jgi:hypothetical protein
MLLQMIFSRKTVQTRPITCTEATAMTSYTGVRLLMANQLRLPLVGSATSIHPAQKAAIQCGSLLLLVGT